MFLSRGDREGGTIGLVQDGDPIEIDVPARTIALALPEAEIEKRRSEMKALGRAAWKPKRDRKVSAALRAYAALATSAAHGAVRDVDQVGG